LWEYSERSTGRGETEMKAAEDTAKALKELRSESARQFEELKADIAALKGMLEQVLGKPASGAHPVEHKGPVAADAKGRERPFKMYCVGCCALQTVTALKQTRMPDGSLAIEGACSVCGTRVFRMGAMSGALVSEAAEARIRGR
jgi:hypothetical protein